tara:strand:- start:282 stop:566 length:285 start_codon:yes stop_codon:yes gene_type:complete
MNREQRRSAVKQSKKDGTGEMQEKIMLFGKLEDECLTCQKPFNKKDKEMVMSWQVVVRQEEEKVNLYCPECWDKAIQITEDFMKRVEERNEDSP